MELRSEYRTLKKKHTSMLWDQSTLAWTCNSRASCKTFSLPSSDLFFLTTAARHTSPEKATKILHINWYAHHQRNSSSHYKSYNANTSSTGGKLSCSSFLLRVKIIS